MSLELSAVPPGFKRGSGTRDFEYWYGFISVGSKTMLLAIRRKKKGGKANPYTLLSESLLKNLRNDDDIVRKAALSHQNNFAFPLGNDQIETLVRKHWPDLVVAGAASLPQREEQVSV